MDALWRSSRIVIETVVRDGWGGVVSTSGGSKEIALLSVVLKGLDGDTVALLISSSFFFLNLAVQPSSMALAPLIERFMG